MEGKLSGVKVPFHTAWAWRLSSTVYQLSLRLILFDTFSHKHIIFLQPQTTGSSVPRVRLVKESGEHIAAALHVFQNTITDAKYFIISVPPGIATVYIQTKLQSLTLYQRLHAHNVCACVSTDFADSSQFLFM